MAKKFGKLLMVTAALGAGAGEEFKEGIQAAKAEVTDKVVGGVKKVEEFFDDDDESDGSMDAM